MADATTTNTKYGWHVDGTGGTDATTVTTDRLRVKGIVCVTAASAEAIVITEINEPEHTGGAREVLRFTSGLGDLSKSYHMHGITLNGIIVTCAAAASVCVILE